jgi:hypothetical protein
MWQCLLHSVCRRSDTAWLDDGSVPIAAVGGNRERSFAKSAEIWEAAIRYALVLFLSELRLCSGSIRSNSMTRG